MRTTKVYKDYVLIYTVQYELIARERVRKVSNRKSQESAQIVLLENAPVIAGKPDVR